MIFRPKICRDVEKSIAGYNSGLLVGIIRSKNRAEFFGRFLAKKFRPIFCQIFNDFFALKFTGMLKKLSRGIILAFW